MKNGRRDVARLTKRKSPFEYVSRMNAENETYEHVRGSAWIFWATTLVGLLVVAEVPCGISGPESISNKGSLLTIRRRVASESKNA